MCQLSGFIDADHSNHVCKLCKAIYWLRQVLCAWYHELHNYLAIIRFENSQSYHSLFIYLKNGVVMYKPDKILHDPLTQHESV